MLSMALLNVGVIMFSREDRIAPGTAICSVVADDASCPPPLQLEGAASKARSSSQASGRAAIGIKGVGAYMVPKR